MTNKQKVLLISIFCILLIVKFVNIMLSGFAWPSLKPSHQISCFADLLPPQDLMSSMNRPLHIYICLLSIGAFQVPETDFLEHFRVLKPLILKNFSAQNRHHRNILGPKTKSIGPFQVYRTDPKCKNHTGTFGGPESIIGWNILYFQGK